MGNKCRKCKVDCFSYRYGICKDCYEPLKEQFKDFRFCVKEYLEYLSLHGVIKHHPLDYIVDEICKINNEQFERMGKRFGKSIPLEVFIDRQDKGTAGDILNADPYL